MNRANLSNLIRNAGLLRFADFLRFQILRLKNLPENRDFKRKNPSVKLPPDYLLYESFAIDYPAYYNGGKISASDIYGYLSKHQSQKNLNVLDWGCGPGRIIRHMPGILGDDCALYGTDYNSRSIKWCSENIQDIQFSENGLSPPLDFQSNLFDMIYGISIFTHLSEEMHHAWIKELHRVLKKDGVLLLTTAGKAFKAKLTDGERSRFENAELITRSRVKEGHRTFTAFHPAGFMRDLFSEFTILEHIEREADGRNIPQDIWIIKKT